MNRTKKCISFLIPSIADIIFIISFSSSGIFRGKGSIGRCRYRLMDSNVELLQYLEGQNYDTQLSLSKILNRLSLYTQFYELESMNP